MFTTAFFAPVAVIIDVGGKCVDDGAPVIRFSIYVHKDGKRSKWLQTAKTSPAPAKSRRPTTIMHPRRLRTTRKSPSRNHRQTNT